MPHWPFAYSGAARSPSSCRTCARSTHAGSTAVGQRRAVMRLSACGRRVRVRVRVRVRARVKVRVRRLSACGRRVRVRARVKVRVRARVKVRVMRLSAFGRRVTTTARRTPSDWTAVAPRSTR